MRTCQNCGEEVDDRGYPTAGKWYIMWVPVWVHANGGYKYCDPQAGADSPMAEPTGCDHPEDYRGDYEDRSGIYVEHCILCGEDIEHTT